MNVRRWWNNNWRGEIKVLAQIPVSFQSSNYKYHMECPGIEFEPSGEKAATNRLS
jgi:hypothetical protein